VKLTRSWIALYVGVVFLSGGVLGFFANRLYTVQATSSRYINPNGQTTTSNTKAPPSPEEFRRWLIAEYQRRLQLNPDQVTKLELILDDTNAGYKDTRSKMDESLKQIRQHQTDRINEMLTSTQRAEYEKMRKEREERQKQQRQKGRPGNGGV